MSGIILYPLATEKSIRLMESENKLVFVVDSKANKIQVREEIEKEFKFKVKVVNIRTMIDTKGRKKAYVKFSAETPAMDVATKLGLM